MFDGAAASFPFSGSFLKDQRCNKAKEEKRK
jgi:hypothetical protein